MSEIVLYRKYRPSKFKEVLGQDHIIKVLEGALKMGNVAHAYLFSGSRGTGKTSVARIMANDLGCSVNDVHEIDAASNRGIDDIRELREAVRTLPFDSKYKIYIVDEVHMLTREAFNALLKTLEEPPNHVIFILATTELQKVPETIISRCQTFVFKKPSDNSLKSFILEIVKKEKFKLDSGSAELIAILGDGSFRDALGILQKVISFSKDNKISSEEVTQVTGAPSTGLVNQFIESIINNDLEKGFSAVKQAGEQNIDMKLYLKLILHKMRLALLLRFSPETRKELEKKLSQEDIEFIKNILKGKSDKINSKTLLGLYS